MPPFRCKMATPSGRIVENTMISDSKDSLKTRLEKDGNFVLEIQKIKGSGTLIKKARGNIRLKGKELYSFNLEFSVLLRAGLSIVSALDAIIEKDDKSDLNELLKVIRIDIAHGESLSNAFANYSHIFSNLYIASLKAGEKSGDVPLALTRYIEYLKSMAAIRQKVIAASIYPLILLTASVFVLIFLLLFVVPSITGTFAETGTSLPYMTQKLLDISLFIKGKFLWFAFLGVLVSAAIIYYRKTPKGKIAMDRAFLAVPFIGTLHSHYSTAKFSRTLATILSGGVTLIESLKIACGVVENRYLRYKIESISINLKQGEGFSDSLKQTGVFPGLAVRMIAAGENSGALEQVLNDVADFYEGDVETKLSILTSAIEPALMIIMGLTIGFIVMAMYMPIFQMAGTIG